MRRFLLAAAVAVALVLSPGAAAAAGIPDELGPAAAAEPPTTTGTGTVVTLVTGDRVTIARDADGRESVAVEPAGREGYQPSFDAVLGEDGTYVVPSDAARLVPDALDRELFNVTKLAGYGYTDGVPVITTYPGGPRTRSAVAGATVTADLPSVDGVAATIDTSGAWWRAMAGKAAPQSLAGATKVWLDGRVQPVLAESVPQIGAPAAWQAGYDGAGMTVAVLDTGIDAGHPDLAGKVAAQANLTNSDTAADRHGHGTHVASIAAGTGAASDGTYVGVAPRAELLNGKVLNDFGFGQQSWIIAGMEWAAQQGADVVNMSLGGDPSDGTDPISAALNRLTEQHDMLFVVAAGNDGPSEQTVTAPAAADAALSVGNVSKTEDLHILSSRGPRLGDFALKPDITAPGVDIVAARSADGTLPPPAQPVDDFHLRATGTSMAAPHVAGGAALLLQQRPGLTADELKAALVTSAAPSAALDTFEQGGGRVDVAAAIGARVRAAPAPVDFGVFEFPHDGADPAHAEVTYTNLTDETLSLDLSFDVASADDAVPGDAMLAVEPATVTLGPAESGEVRVTLDVARGEIGLYSGYLVAAEEAAAAARTPLSFYKQEELHELRLVGIARDGDPADRNSSLDIVNIDGSHELAEYLIPFGADGEVTLQLPPGVYGTSARIDSYLSSELQAHETTVVAEPEIVLDGDTTVVLDARDGVELTVDTPAHDDATPHRFTFGYLRRGAGSDMSWLALREEWNRFFVVPTEPPATGEQELYTHWRLGEPKVALEVADSTAELAFPPVLFPDSPVLDTELVRPLVDAGFGTAEEFESLDAEGAIVLLRRGGPTSFYEKGANAAAAGAAALLVANDRPGQVPSYGIGPDATMPAVRLSQQDGDALLDLLDQGDVTLRLWGSRNTDYLYELVYPEPGGIPSDLAYVAGVEELATIENAFHSDVGGVEVGEYREQFRPWQASSVVFVNDLVGPQHRTEYLTPGDSRHRQRVRMPAGSMQEYLTSYRPGELREQSWWRQVARPGVRGGSPQESARPARRDGDTLVLELAEWVDADGNWGHRSTGVDTTAFRLFTDGELVAETARGRGQFPMLPEPATHRLELDVAREAEWWTTSTATSTVWTVQSERPAGGGTAVLPLLLVDYDIELDLRNAAQLPRDRRGPAVVGLEVHHQPGVEGPPIARAQAWVSYDDGRSWRARPALRRGDGRFDVVLDARDPAGTSGFASLRVVAWDTGNNRIEQEIIRAWKVPGGRS